MRKKRIYFQEDGGGVLRRAAFASNDSLAGEVEDLGLFLLPNGRPGAIILAQKKKKPPWKPLWIYS
jgi:hypothetical protein